MDVVVFTCVLAAAPALLATQPPCPGRGCEVTSPLYPRQVHQPLTLAFMGQLNLAGFNMTGPETKFLLFSLNASLPVRRLFLSHNALYSLPEQTFPPQLEYCLQELRLDNNPLAVLGAITAFELSRLKALRSLKLSRTGLLFLPTLSLPVLEDLDLSDNLLNFIPPSLESLPNLQVLHLSRNRISDVDRFPFSSLDNLRVLSLADNRITNIRDDPFKDLYQLEVLYLNNNLLIDVAVVQNVPYPATVFLSANPWRCDCALLTVALREGPSVADKDTLTCVFGKTESPALVNVLSEPYPWCEGPAWVKHTKTDFRAGARRAGDALAEWVKEYVGVKNMFLLLEAFFVLYLVLQIYSVVLITRRVKRRWAATSGSTPYTKLVDNEYI